MESLVAMAASFCSQLLYCSAIYALIVRLWSFELFFVRNKLNLMLVFEIMGQFFCVSLGSGLIKVDLEFSFSIPGLFQTWNSNKPGFEKLNSRSEPGFGKLNSRSELELSKKTIIN